MDHPFKRDYEINIVLIGNQAQKDMHTQVHIYA